MNLSDLVQFLKKDPAEFIKEDIISFCEEMAIEMVNFRYVAGDDKPKVAIAKAVKHHSLYFIQKS
ncbi:hypothetical protein [Methanorbis rubei]